MATMCIQDLPREEVVQLRAHPQYVIRDALNVTCERLGLAYVHTETVIEGALEERRLHNLSPAAAIAFGTKTANNIAVKLERIRERFPHGPQPPRDAA